MKSPNASSAERCHDVIVLGAGIAGVMAARTLKQAGVDDTVVLEARPRIGGRIHTDYKLAHGRPVEMGAEFIHTESGIMNSLASELGLTLVEAPMEGLHYDEKLTDQNGLLSEIIDDLRALAERLLASGSPDISVRDFLVRPDASRIIDETRIFTKKSIEQLLRNDYCAEPETLGIAGLIEPSVTGYHRNFRIQEGYSELVKRAAEGLDIRLKTPIESIDWTKKEEVVLRSAKQRFSARELIVTLPLGVLKHGDVQFNPPLPDEKLKAIASLGAGNACKIILLFEKAFWPEDMGFLSTTLDSQLLWPSTLPKTNGDGEAALLTTLIGGKAVHRFEKSHRSDIRDEAALQLQRMFTKKTVKKGLLSESASKFWGSSRYSRMGWSFLPAGCDEHAREELGKPLGDHVYFAGEAVAPDGEIGFTHGAAKSGVRAAEAVMKNFR